MPKHDNCEDLQVESCVDDNGQTIQGGDSYAVPTGRYVKHVVSVCDAGGGVNAGGLETRACDGGGLEETWQGPDALCLSIKTEDDSALVLDNGVLKIDSTKLKVTSDNVLPAGTDPGLLSTGPYFTDPDGNVWNNQSDYNKWLYEDQKRQDGEIEGINNEIENINDNLDDYVLKTEFEKDQERQDDELGKLTEEIEEIKDTLGTSCDSPDITDTLGTSAGLDNLAWVSSSYLKVGKELHNNNWPNPEEEKPDFLTVNNEQYEVESVGVGSAVNWYYFLPAGSLDHLVGQEVTVSLCSSDGGNFVTKEEFAEDQKRQDDIYLNRYGDNVDDAGAVTYSWADDVNINSGRYFNLNATDINVASKYDVSISADSLINLGANADISLSSNNGGELVLRRLKGDEQAEQIVNLRYLKEDQKRQDDALAEEMQARAERDALHDAQINTIEYKLDALVGLQFKGIYEFKHENDCNLEYERCIDNCMAIDPQDHECRQLCGRNQMDCEREKVRPGFFEAVDPDDQFDHLEYIVISKNDKAGVEIDWAGVLDAGDYLEVDHTADGVLDKTNYGLYRILEEPEHSQNAYGEDVYTLHLEFLQGDGVMNVRENYEIRGITAAEGVNPEELGDFLTKEEAAATYATKGHSHSNYAASNHTHSNYASSSHTHSGYASSSHSHSNMAIMKITTSTSPSLNQGEMAWNKNNYTLYIGK